MEYKDVRWEQRFANYRKALTRLSEAATQATVEKLSDLEEEGLIQRFEYTYELAWKTLQDLLREKGYVDLKGPKDVLNQAFLVGYIEGDAAWRAMKKSRELTSHTYDQGTASEIAKAIVETYWQLLKDLESRLEEERYGRQTTIFDE
ncbi:nucleotidyltransferase substrate binding protein [Spirosoma rhododendri]|uniref:Nucleotidyltransferase n=1 Tax=Spirosoma rhododendri TaxID=2728024 RepID=A0A7L5DQD9_9BACT|nr:nucleotidyltransferase substrate binding protein [Spirosoma rhododendri]QJD79792.1 nucleotidyltransferase [Spirosoma rhododendri]